MHGFTNTNLPPHLRVLKEEIEQHARAYGLDFYETIFEVIDAEDLNEVAAYGGFPTRYPHWSFGMSYEELKKGYDYGLSKIYEMVINNDPCYAYLMRCNHTVDQKLVMAHVYGHCDFFKNNAYFAHTNRKMMDEMANHGARVRRYVERFGEDEVEGFLDRCLSIDDLIDIHSTAIRRREPVSRYEFRPTIPRDDEEQMRLTRFKSKDYMDEYINPREALKAEEEERRKKMEAANRNFPERPEKDALLFLFEGSWRRLDELSVGDRVRISRGTDMWAADQVALDWQPSERLTVTSVAERTGVSLRTFYRHVHGRRTRAAEQLDGRIAEYRN